MKLNIQMNDNEYIPLSVPQICGNEWKYVKECLDTEWVSSAGKYVDLFEQKVCEYTNSEYAIACVNGTSAIQVSLRISGVEPGDLVICPTLTFIAPVNAIRYNGADPIFMDSDNYYNIDVQKTIEFIEDRTIFKNGYTFCKKTHKKISALIPVHVWGNAVQLDRLVTICKNRNISLVEDASESLGTVYNRGEYKDKATGTIGELGCLSFNGNKIITAGGGGMILTNSIKFAEKAKYLTTQAKDDPLMYIHNEIGYNFRLTNLSAAVGVAQLEQLEKYIKQKRIISDYYKRSLEGINTMRIAKVPNYSNNNHWINILVFKDRIDISNIINYLEKNGIQSRPIWKLNHMQKPYLSCQNYKIEMAEKLVQKSLCLPSSVNLNKGQIDYIVDTIKKYG